MFSLSDNVILIPIKMYDIVSSLSDNIPLYYRNSAIIIQKDHYINNWITIMGTYYIIGGVDCIISQHYSIYPIMVCRL